MARKLYYGPHEIAIKDDGDLPTILESVQEAANSGEARWVEIPAEGDPHRILVQQGVPVFIVGKGKPATVAAFR